MANSYTPNLQITLMATGDQSGQWGTTTNNNFLYAIEQAITGGGSIACTGGTDGTGAITSGATSPTARNVYLTLTGTGGGTLVVPTTPKLYFVYNSTSAAITIRPGTFSPNTPTGTGISVPTGATYALYCNGTNVVNAISANSVATVSSAAPSATIGLTTVTGSAITFMTSDSAPALSQAITPTWTGAHIWSAAVTFNSTASFTGAVTFSSTTTPTINDGAGNQVAVGFRGMPQTTGAGTQYQAALSDRSKYVLNTAGGLLIVAAPYLTGSSGSTGTWTTDSVISFYNSSSSSQTITAGTGVTLQLVNTTTTGNRTVAAHGFCTLVCVVGGSNPTFICMGPGVS